MVYILLLFFNTRDISCEQTHKVILFSFNLGVAEVEKESAQVKI